jgi:hypothetical protein
MTELISIVCKNRQYYIMMPCGPESVSCLLWMGNLLVAPGKDENISVGVDGHCCTTHTSHLSFIINLANIPFAFLLYWNKFIYCNGGHFYT